jgi:hypothetical protein
VGCIDSVKCISMGKQGICLGAFGPARQLTGKIGLALIKPESI